MNASRQSMNMSSKVLIRKLHPASRVVRALTCLKRIHEKCWQGWVERRLAELFYERLGRMEGYWLAKELNGTIPTSDPYG